MEKQPCGEHDQLHNKFGMELTKDPETWLELAEKYNLAYSEIAQIDFNRSGICLPNKEVREDFRVRFKGELFDQDESWFALPVRNPRDTNFSCSSGVLYFGNKEIGQTKNLMLDTCESSYQRGPHLLNLNSRSRSNCGGCRACVHNYKNLYDKTVVKDDMSLSSRRDLDAFFKESEIDVPNLKQIAVVTGLFGSENEVVQHMKLVNTSAKDMGFHGELMYFGCEINSAEALDELSQIDNFSLVYALDNFTKRKKLLAKTKSLITIDHAKRTLDAAKERRINTTIAYISGIDPVFDMGAGFLEIKNSLTRFPIINIYQIQTAGQASILDESAKSLEYYIQSRIVLEDIFSDTTLRPRRWENYRPLWYQYFNNEKLPSNSYGELE